MAQVQTIRYSQRTVFQELEPQRSGDRTFHVGLGTAHHFGLSQGNMPKMGSVGDWGPGLAYTLQCGVPAGTAVGPFWGMIVIVAWATNVLCGSLLLVVLEKLLSICLSLYPSIIYNTLITIYSSLYQSEWAPAAWNQGPCWWYFKGDDGCFFLLVSLLALSKMMRGAGAQKHYLRESWADVQQGVRGW